MIIAAYPSEPYAHMIPFDQLFSDIKRANHLVKDIQLPGSDVTNKFRPPRWALEQLSWSMSLKKTSDLEKFSDKLVAEPGEAAGRTLPGEVLIYEG